MGKKTPVNVSVRMGGQIKTVEQLIRRFLKLCKEEGIAKEVKDRSYFISKNQKRRKKKICWKITTDERGFKKKVNELADCSNIFNKREKRGVLNVNSL